MSRKARESRDSRKPSTSRRRQGSRGGWRGGRGRKYNTRTCILFCFFTSSLILFFLPSYALLLSGRPRVDRPKVSNRIPNREAVPCDIFDSVRRRNVIIRFSCGPFDERRPQWCPNYICVVQLSRKLEITSPHPSLCLFISVVVPYEFNLFPRSLRSRGPVFEGPFSWYSTISRHTAYYRLLHSRGKHYAN